MNNLILILILLTMVSCFSEKMSYDIYVYQVIDGNYEPNNLKGVALVKNELLFFPYGIENYDSIPKNYIVSNYSYLKKLLKEIDIKAIEKLDKDNGCKAITKNYYIVRISGSTNKTKEITVSELLDCNKNSKFKFIEEVKNFIANESV